MNNAIVLQNDIDSCKTNHILHLILTVLTGGLWAFVWVLVSFSNSRKRKDSLSAQGLQSKCVCEHYVGELKKEVEELKSKITIIEYLQDKDMDSGVGAK